MYDIEEYSNFLGLNKKVVGKIIKAKFCLMKELDLLHLLLPSELPDYFEIVQIETTLISYNIHLKERNLIPKEYQESMLMLLIEPFRN